MNARRIDPHAALIPVGGQVRKDQYIDSTHTDIRKTFSEVTCQTRARSIWPHHFVQIREQVLNSQPEMPAECCTELVAEEVGLKPAQWRVLLATCIGTWAFVLLAITLITGAWS